MLDDTLKPQLAGLPRNACTQPIELVASLDDGDTSRRDARAAATRSLRCADKITLRTDGHDARKPSFA